MPALSGGDLTTWRTSPYNIQTDVFVHAPATVFAALVNQSSFTYPLTSITFDTVTTGAYTDIEEGQLLLIGTTAGADDLGRTRVRKTLAGTIATSSVLYLQRSSNGTRDGEVNPSDNVYLTVLDLRKPWSVAPYIDTDGVSYMDTDKTFSHNRSCPPVANGDPDVLIVVRDGSTSVNVSFGNVPHLVTNPDATTSVAHAWVFHSTCTPATSSSATVTVAVPVNTVFYARHTVTDSAGTAATHYSLVAVVDASHADLKPCRIASHVARADGQQITLEFVSALPYTTYPDGTEVLIAKTERFGNSTANLAGLADRKQMVFAGWVHEEENEGQATEYGFRGRTTLTCLDAAQWLAVLPGFPTIVERESSPTRWEHMKTATLDRYVHRILHAYSNILSRACFTWSGTGTTYAFPTLGSDGMSLYEQADQRTQAIAYKLTCDKHGRLAMKADPLLIASGSRTSTVIVAIEERDWRLYRYRFTRPPRTHWNWGEAIGAQGIDAEDIGEVTTYFCVAPGEAPGQGLGNQTSGQQLVGNQSELNVREGHRYAARMNSQYGYIEVTLRGGDAGIDPALMEWIQFEVTAATSGPRNRTFSASTDRFLPVEVNYDYEPDGGIRVCRVSIEKEIQGQAATTYYPPQDSYTPWPFPEFPFPDPGIWTPDTTYPEDYWLRGGTSRIAAICQLGIARTTNFGSGAATTWDFISWQSIFGSSAYYQAWGSCPDAFSYSGGGVKGWAILSGPGGSLGTWKLVYFNVAAQTGTLKHTFSGPTPPVMRDGGDVSIDASFGSQGFIVASAYSTSVGTYCARSADNTTFTEVQISANLGTIGGNDESPAVPGTWVSSRTPGRAVVQAYYASGHRATHQARVTTDYGATWSDTSDPDMSVSKNIGAAGLFSPYDLARNPSESIFFWMARDTSGGSGAIGLFRDDGTSSAKIASYLSCAARNPIGSASGNANRLIVSDQLGSGKTYITNNALAASPTFTEVTALAGAGAMCNVFAGDNPNVIYAWHGLFKPFYSGVTQGPILLSADGGATFRSQIGDLPGVATTGCVLSLMGW